MDVRPLEGRMAEALVIWGRQDLTPVVLPGKRSWPVRSTVRRFMLSEPLGNELDDAQLRALIGFQLTRSRTMTARAWVPYMLPVIGLALTTVAAGINLSSALLALAVVLMLLSLFPLLRSATYGWAEAPRIRAYLGQGGDPGYLAAALWKMTVTIWAGSGGFAYALISFHGVLGALAEQTGCSGEELLSRGGIEVEEDDEPEEIEAPKTWWKVNNWWITLTAGIAILLALRFLR